jgi:hypothetical protein
VDDVIGELIRLGWECSGRTLEETVRVPTRKSPLYGKSGGELATFGGRTRLKFGEWRVTVGKRITFFYHINADGTFSPIPRVPTNIKDVVACEYLLRRTENGFVK